MTHSWNRLWRSYFVVFSIILWAKFALLRYFLYGKVDLKWWLLDLFSLLVFTGFMEIRFANQAKRSAYWAFNAILSLICFAATLYFEHFGSVITYTSVLEIKQLLQISSSIKATIHPMDYLFFADFILAFMIWLATRRHGAILINERPMRRSALFVLTLVCIMVSAWFVKTDKDITNEIVRAEQLGFMNYEVSVAVNGISEKNKTNFANLTQALTVINQVEADYGYNQGANPADKPNYFASQQGMNVVVVQIEAFQNFLIHLTYQGKEITPVLNNLAEESLYFPHIYQQIGQGNTSDAEFMSNTSIYPTGTIPMSTGYGDRMLPSLPRLLEEKGYEADTFHVNEIHFWDRIKLYPAIGFTHYFDKPYYTNDNFNSFGASDEELFRVGSEKLTELHNQKKPFYTQFITVSSHFPFTVPASFEKIAVPPALQGQQIGDYLVAANYADYALGKFIDQLKTSGMWDQTLFIAYGDHFGLQPEDIKADKLSSELGITYHDQITRFNIPLFIHMPRQSKGEVINQVGGQLDIMPTIANLVGVSLKEQGVVHFGQDLLNIKKNAFGMRYYLPTGSFFNDHILFVPGKGFDDGTAVSLQTLQPVADFKAYKSDYDYVMTLMKLSDQYVNMLPKR
ncbi:LTA synthase family protein [Paenibacillus sp. N3.4]|uniref:LTA synthase family protein n=1 Tax=Paenibacillus sp. N3.4 TaxID=2603222 RepID=UPI0011C9494B|nr:LTA synthase family protein [Paenibacillus sp. N3.4]TXK80598.1 sulfatase-like hydrolase/transferase [Paenibacillus sp. N3.4]